MTPDDPIGAFLEALAARSSTPGGGAIAAMSGAQGCALVSMVCRFTRGNGTDAALAHAESARQQFLDDAAADVACFDAVMAHWKAGGDALQEALKAAAEVPLLLAERAATFVPDLERLETDGNPNLITDTGIAAQQFAAAIDAARLNVLINLKSIEDDAWVSDITSRLDALMPARAALQSVADRITSRLSS